MTCILSGRGRIGNKSSVRMGASNACHTHIISHLVTADTASKGRFCHSFWYPYRTPAIATLLSLIVPSVPASLWRDLRAFTSSRNAEKAFTCTSHSRHCPSQRPSLSPHSLLTRHWPPPRTHSSLPISGLSAMILVLCSSFA